MSTDQPVIDAPPYRLRPFVDGDSELIESASADHLITNITTVPPTADHDGALAFINRQHSRVATGEGLSYAIARAVDDVSIGQVGLTYQCDERASMGYWVGPAHRGAGAAAAALRALSCWALANLPIARVELYVEQWNVASLHTAENAGFEPEGLLRSWQRVDGVRRDMWIYARVT